MSEQNQELSPVALLGGTHVLMCLDELERNARPSRSLFHFQTGSTSSEI